MAGRMCGVIGVFQKAGDVFPDAINGLFQMQHRGQDACGLAVSTGTQLLLHKGLGHVREVFRTRPSEAFAGPIAIGHVRYPTQGGNSLVNAQPHLAATLAGPRMALSSNGDLVNYGEVRRDLESRGVAFLGGNDAEVILKFIAWHHLEGGLTVLEAIRHMQRTIRGAYSSILMLHDRLYAIRDPYALRPMTIGGDERMVMVASETPALDIARLPRLFDPEPGEIVEISAEGMVRHAAEDPTGLRAAGRETSAHCIFEHIYFSRPDSFAFGTSVYEMRKRIGAWLAEREECDIDVVVPVPDSSNAVALGYAQASGKPFELGLIRNHYVGRTFIHPDQAGREDSVKHKFNPQRSVLEGRRVVLVDDSIVRGTTLRKITRMVRAAGAREVHLRIGSPVTRFPCYYGVDTPNRDELIGNQLDEEGIREHLTADSLRYIPIEGLRDAFAGSAERYCMACFDGHYPEPLREQKDTKDASD